MKYMPGTLVLTAVSEETGWCMWSHDSQQRFCSFSGCPSFLSILYITFSSGYSHYCYLIYRWGSWFSEIWLLQAIELIIGRTEMRTQGCLGGIFEAPGFSFSAEEAVVFELSYWLFMARESDRNTPSRSMHSRPWIKQISGQGSSSCLPQDFCWAVWVDWMWSHPLEGNEKFHGALKDPCLEGRTCWK